MENESDRYDNVTQDISLTQSMRSSDSAAPSNSTEPLVSAAPPTSTELPVFAAPPTSTELPVFAAPPNSTESPISAAPINSNATVEQNATPYPDAPPEYTSIEPSSPPPPYSNPSQYPPTLGIPYLQTYPRGIPGTGCHPHGQHQYPPLGFAQSQGPKPHPHQPHPHQPQPYQQQQQQQQQRVITVDNNCQSAPVVASPVSMTGAIVLACFVTWFCAYVCGLMALRMACAGRRLAEVGETMRAIRMRRASYCFSITGIVFGLIIIIVLVCVLTTSKSTSSDKQAHVPTNNCHWILFYYKCS